MGELGGERSDNHRPRGDIRIVFVDLDGTLLDAALTLAESTRAAVIATHDCGVPTVIATGRPFQSVAQFVVAGNHSALAIVSNGGAVVDLATEKVLWAAAMAIPATLTALSIAAKFGVALCGYSPTRWYAAGPAALIDIEQRRSGTLPAGNLDATFADLPLIKLMFIGDPSVLARVADELAEHAAEYAHWFYTYPEYLEVMPRGATKGQAVKWTLGNLGLTSEHAMAIGDGDNDLEMLMSVDFRVAMANASKALLEIAHFVAPPNTADGAGIALRAFVLRDETAMAMCRRTAAALGGSHGG